MLVFIGLALAIYGLANFYVGRRGAQALAGTPAVRTVFVVLFVLMTVAYPLSRMIRGFAGDIPSKWLTLAGSVHMVVMLYGLLIVALIDLVRLLNAFWPFVPRDFAIAGRPGLVIFLAAAGVILATIAAGAWNAARPRLVDLEIHLPRRGGAADRLTAVVVSDIHLGTLIGRRKLETIVARINALEPDVVLFPGDIVDESVTDRIEADLRPVMTSIRSRLGVFAVPGNHEFYSGLERTLACLRACGITVLEDRAVPVGGAFILAGRRDPSSLGKGERRRPIRDILAEAGFDGSLPAVLLDHQPAHLEDAEEAGVSLQLSGHTHAGQLFPLDIINRMVWELNWGTMRKGATQYYVSSGVGTWGPPVRTGSRPEIVRLALVFDAPAGEPGAAPGR